MSDLRRRVAEAAGWRVEQRREPPLVTIFARNLTAAELLELVDPSTITIWYLLLWRITDKYRHGKRVSRKWQWRWK